MKKFILAFIGFMLYCTVFGQTRSTQLPYFTFSKGLGIAPPDSAFSVNFRFRMQNRVAFKREDNDTEVEARVRRLRLKFNGFVYSPKLTYAIELFFSRGDIDFESLLFPNVVGDAWVQYAFSKHLSVGVGQTKLPGNRQRVNSSGDLQLVDRSSVNAIFNVDRDFGVQFTYRKPNYVVRGAVSSGEGRNINASDNGLAYTGRVELLPFGTFTKGGDYFEGDLAREKKPKVSIGLGYCHNEKAIRTGGQLGNYLYASRDIKTQMVDFLYKYNGWAFAAEYLKRITPSPVTEGQNGSQRYVYVGVGQNYQGSYVFKNNVEVVGRYSLVSPESSIHVQEKIKDQFTLGLNKYLKGHRVKLQSDVTLERSHSAGSSTVGQAWIFRFQVEAGI